MLKLLIHLLSKYLFNTFFIGSHSLPGNYALFLLLWILFFTILYNLSSSLHLPRKHEYSGRFFLTHCFSHFVDLLDAFTHLSSFILSCEGDSQISISTQTSSLILRLIYIKAQYLMIFHYLNTICSTLDSHISSKICSSCLRALLS